MVKQIKGNKKRSYLLHYSLAPTGSDVADQGLVSLMLRHRAWDQQVDPYVWSKCGDRNRTRLRALFARVPSIQSADGLVMGAMLDLAIWTQSGGHGGSTTRGFAVWEKDHYCLAAHFPFRRWSIPENPLHDTRQIMLNQRAHMRGKGAGCEKEIEVKQRGGRVAFMLTKFQNCVAPQDEGTSHQQQAHRAYPGCYSISMVRYRGGTALPAGIHLLLSPVHGSQLSSGEGGFQTHYCHHLQAPTQPLKA
ncbi:predicted protein [Histoplasma capsulatum var. duboisii H88]|uniref:Predicted protein n=1 Tax=Ajellomyces capsulatus (strain H88) TaxID=544711 RepID=F0UFG7_AJEC8|nr:predicted protein [Histoplasma capsulatum var. duboisii H88]